jgi:hypothetical protein
MKKNPPGHLENLLDDKRRINNENAQPRVTNGGENLLRPTPPLPPQAMKMVDLLTLDTEVPDFLINKHNQFPRT